MHRLRDLAIPLANPKMFDKLQFVVAFGSGRVVETSDKLKFVEHFHRILAQLLSRVDRGNFTPSPSQNRI